MHCAHFSTVELAKTCVFPDVRGSGASWGGGRGWESQVAAKAVIWTHVLVEESYLGDIVMNQAWTGR